jgi:hypothetical protein
MPRRTPAAANTDARLCAPSRRTILGGAAVPLIVSGADPAVAASETWLARRAERERLCLRWQQIEKAAFALHDWPKLSRTQRARHREQLEMDALDDEMDSLDRQNEALLASLPLIAATTYHGLCGKLAVAALEACPEDHPELHHLIVSILRDYRALNGD